MHATCYCNKGGGTRQIFCQDFNVPLDSRLDSNCCVINHRQPSSFSSSFWFLLATPANLFGFLGLIPKGFSMSQTREPSRRRILRQKKDHLPHDIVLNILANLPVKSVLRFRCVSKTWDSSITTPDFISTHLNLNLNNNNNNLAYLINIPSNSTIRSFIGGYDHTFNRISEYPIPSALLLSSAKYVTPCNGLLCLIALTITSHCTVAGVIYLQNPNIRKFKRLPDFFPAKPHWVTSTGFAYQSETNDYKVVKISQIRSPNHGGVELEVEVYTLSSNSWRRVGISLTDSALGAYTLSIIRLPYMLVGLCIGWDGYHRLKKLDNNIT